MTELAVRPSSGFDVAVIEPLSSLAERICRTDFVPASLRGKPEATLAAMLTGEELGIKPMTALQKIHVIEGRPGLAAELMRALILQHGHDIWIEEKSITRVTVAGQRKGSERVSKVTWTADDVKRAGLDGRPNHKKYPRAMLTARATAELARDIFPDLIGGLYAIEELADGFAFGADGDVVDIDPDTLEADEPKTHKRSKTTGRATTSKRKPAGSTEGPSHGKTTTDRERPPAPPIGSAPIDVEVIEDTEPEPVSTTRPEREEKGYKGVDGVKASPTEPGPEPDDAFPPLSPEEQAEAEAAARNKVFGTFAGAQEVDAVEETGEIADRFTVSRLRKKLGELDEEQLAAVAQEWDTSGIGSIRPDANRKLLLTEVVRAEDIIERAIEAQADIYDRRRKAALASLSEIGITDDDARHEFIKRATNGETESSKALLGRHMRAINETIEASNAEQSGADQ